MRTLPPVALLCLFLAAPGQARPADPEVETTFPAGEDRVGAYLAPALRFNSANEQFGVWVGGRLGLVVNQVLSVGLEGYGLATKAEADRPFGERLNAGVAGAYAEIVFNPHRKIHTTLSLLSGAGTAVAEPFDDVSGDDASDNSFFVLEPEFGLEYNLTRDIRFAPALSYRWISGTITPLDTKWDLSETSLNFRLKFGDFDGKPTDERW